MNRKFAKIYRFWPELRSSHLEMLDEVATSTFLFMKTKSDFDPTISHSRSRIIKKSFISTVWLILRDRPLIIEVPEPLYIRYLSHTATLITFIRLASFFSSWKPKFVTYCIDNSGIHKKPRPLEWLPLVIWISSVTPLIRFVASSMDKIAFGSGSSKDALLDWLSPDQKLQASGKSKVFLALPKACRCNAELPKKLKQVLFLAALESRKGFVELMDAWTTVIKQDPQAILFLVGSGPLSGLATEFASTVPGVKFVGSQGRQEVHKILRQSELVVLPSISTGRWREQLGLSLLEGLAHGCKIVASRDTGLADYLERENQVVLSRHFTALDLSDGILDALYSRQAVNTNSLPTGNQRVAADLWLVSS